jgi:radical SAM protein with 4Fe4S-binding SPASM domain
MTNGRETPTFELHELKIELTQHCPLACVHCSTNSTRKQTSALPLDLVLRLLREGAELGVSKVVFTGGEPLTAESLFKALCLAASLGLHSTVYTSGILDNALTPMSASLAADLVRMGVGRFIFSLYSHRPEIHDSVTRYGSHASTLTALENAVEVGVPVEIHFVAMRRNFRDLPGVVVLADAIGVEKVSVLRFVPQGRGRNIVHQDDLGTDEFTELAQSISSLRQHYSHVTIRAGSPFNILGLGNVPCNAAQDVLVINHRGDVFPCDAFKNVHYADEDFGSVTTKSLRDVWEHSVFLNHVRSVLASRPGETCGACHLSRSCQSGCLAQKVIREGWDAVKSPDPQCIVKPHSGMAVPELVQISGV